METKICPRCKRELPLTAEYFVKNKSRKNGLSCYCRECKTETYREKHPMKIIRYGFKICPVCKRELPATTEYFHRNKSSRDGLHCQCKECHNKGIAIYHKKHPEVVRNASKRYREKYPEKMVQSRKKWDEKNPNCRKEYAQKPPGIYSILKKNAKNRNLPICSKQEFINWYERQEQKCIYCDIPKELLKLLEWGRKYCRNRLTIDRKDNNRGYTLDNICLACDVCNRAKNEDISFNEMLKVGQSFEKIWRQRLGNK